MKKVMNNIYFHKSSINEVFRKFPKQIEDVKKLLPKVNLDYKVIRFNVKEFNIAFIESKDFDSAKEPIVGDSILFNQKYPNGKLIKSKNQIYHHKHEFVGEDYKGFDIEESKRRSKEYKDKLDKYWLMRIGYKKYWKEFLELNKLQE